MRERAAYDEGEVWETSTRWHRRFPHVFEAANSRRMEAQFTELLRLAVEGRRVFELGCGDGENAEKLVTLGAQHVLGIDVAESFVERAQARVRPGRLEFRVGDAMAPIEGKFGAIVGRAVLHHIDYRTTLLRLFEHNLEPGGAAVFLEPLGGNLLIKLFTQLVRKAHTPDERSFQGEDLAWLETAFPQVEFYPFNYATLFIGILSSMALPTADNIALRFADRFDGWLARRFRGMRTQFRQVIVVIRKPA